MARKQKDQKNTPPSTPAKFRPEDPQQFTGDIKKLRQVRDAIRDHRIYRVDTPEEAYMEALRQWDPDDTPIERFADVRTQHDAVDKYSELGNTPLPQPKPKSNPVNEADENQSSTTPNPFSTKPIPPGSI